MITPHPNAGGTETSRWPGLLALLCLFLGTAGCSSFNHDWKAAARSAPPDSLEGRWEGTWHSDVNDHKNQLLCLITRQTNGVFSARFHAKYRKVFTWSFNYTVPLSVRQRGDAFLFEGEADLGWYAGGHYVYMGNASATNFFSTYRCNYDHGTFQMNRPSANHPR
jgi:hypothetical protein